MYLSTQLNNGRCFQVEITDSNQKTQSTKKVEGV